MTKQKEYVVALRYTSKAGGYAGVITWTPFSSKSEFDRWLASQDIQEVVEEGITDERAVELAKTTPLKCYIMAAVEDSCDPETGEVFGDILLPKIRDLLMMAPLRDVA